MRTETDVQNLSILAIQAAGGAALRNNSGVAREVDDHGQPRVVRYGLGNTSEKFNREFKTGDLVGIYPERVYLLREPAVPGAIYTIGIFCMWECKRPGWRYTGTERERGQWNAIQWVRKRGGRAGFVNHPDQAVAIMLGTGTGAYNG